MFGANQPEALLIPPWGVDDESNRSTGYCAQKWVGLLYPANLGGTADKISRPWSFSGL